MLANSTLKIKISAFPSSLIPLNEVFVLVQYRKCKKKVSAREESKKYNKESGLMRSTRCRSLSMSISKTTISHFVWYEMDTPTRWNNLQDEPTSRMSHPKIIHSVVTLITSSLHNFLSISLKRWCRSSSPLRQHSFSVFFCFAFFLILIIQLRANWFICFSALQGASRWV